MCQYLLNMELRLSEKRLTNAKVHSSVVVSILDELKLIRGQLYRRTPLLLVCKQCRTSYSFSFLSAVRVMFSELLISSRELTLRANNTRIS